MAILMRRCADRGCRSRWCGAGRSASCTRVWTDCCVTRRGQPGKPPLPTETVRRVLDLTLSDPPHEATHWTAAAMAKAAGISPSSVQRIWKAHGLAPHRIRTFKISRDPKFAEKLKDVVGLYVDPPAHAVLLSVDEKRS